MAREVESEDVLRAADSHTDPAHAEGRKARGALRLDEFAADRSWTVRAYVREIRRGEERLAETRATVRALREELDAVHDSTSWRMTAPLRLLTTRYAVVARLVRRGAKVFWWTLSLQLPRRLRERREAIAESSRVSREETYEEWIRAYDTLGESDFDGMHELERALDYRPLVSVLMPVFDPPEAILRAAIDSVRAQVYANWELCIADDFSTQAHVADVLDECRSDDRVRVVRRSENGGISAASNSALALARGELVALLDHDDLLRPHSLLLAVNEFAKRREVGFVYSDADKIDENGRRVSHYFKPDWNPALLRSQNFLCHLSVIRTDLVRKAGGFRGEFDGSQDWDLNLRIVELLPAEAIAHVPHVLYHWRAISGSVAAEGLDAKPYASDAARRATEEHLRRTGRNGYVLPVDVHQKVRFLVPRPRPFVSVVVPSTAREDLLRPCLEGLLSATAYDELEIVVAVSESAVDEPATCRFLEDVAARPSVRLVTSTDRAFNFAQTMNEAIAQTDAELVLLLNDDVEVVHDDWLEALVEYALEDDVGAVGGLLLYPDGTICSAGMLLGARGAAEHLYHRRRWDVNGYSNRARLPQDVSAVAGTCMLVRREAFDVVGGLDESFPVAYNDVDLCLRLRRDGWRVIYQPDAVLVHHGSASFGTHQRGRDEEHTRDAERMRTRWGAALTDDPMHNPNLELDASYPDRLAFPPRVVYPWRQASPGSTDPRRPTGTAP